MPGARRSTLVCHCIEGLQEGTRTSRLTARTAHLLCLVLILAAKEEDGMALLAAEE